MLYFLKLPLSCPIVFFLLAMIFSTYQGIRGVLIQLHNVQNENIQNKNNSFKKWTLPETIYVHRIHDFLFNFVCTIAGFFAWYIEALIINRIAEWSDIGAGTGIFLVFLSLVALAGIAGVLPPILLFGRLFKGQ